MTLRNPEYRNGVGDQVYHRSNMFVKIKYLSVSLIGPEFHRTLTLDPKS